MKKKLSHLYLWLFFFCVALFWYILRTLVEVSVSDKMATFWRKNVTEEQILNYFTSEQFSSEEENIFILSEPTSRPHKLSPPPPPLLPLVLLFFIQTENRKKGLTLFCLFQSRFYEQFLKPFLLDPDNFKNRSPPKQSTTLGTLRW